MIHVEGLSKSFHGETIFEDIRFSVPEASVFVLLGQSGVGKSLLLKLLAGLILPDRGQIKINSKNLGMLFQRNALFDSLRVGDNLDFPLRERTNLTPASRKERIKQYLEWVGLSGTENLFPSELSGGMQKRLGIARALIVEPEVLLYDEPTAGLDPITSREIGALILRLQKELGSTVVCVTSEIARSQEFSKGPAVALGVLTKTKVLPLTQASAEEDPFLRHFIKTSMDQNEYRA